MDVAASLHDALLAFVRRHPRLFVLTGAGISTESGIPCYRDDAGAWHHGPAPMLLREFLGSAEARRRYWARSAAGWPAIDAAAPNPAHHALTALQQLGGVTALVTQNVDGLHGKAGSHEVLELHGNLATVICIACGDLSDRRTLQAQLVGHGGGATADAMALPDGDAHMETRADFVHVPECERCGGILKPDVVFFGEGVPRRRVDAARSALEEADAMLVVGSSLTVYSGYRICEWAAALGKPIAAINRGRTRADALLAFKVQTSCADALGMLVAALSDPRPPQPRA